MESYSALIYLCSSLQNYKNIQSKLNTCGYYEIAYLNETASSISREEFCFKDSAVNFPLTLVRIESGLFLHVFPCASHNSEGELEFLNMILAL